ncbi:MAG: translocation/assembly module TamB domain-containing protein [Sneathiella sp.]|nr:translocation/assembly module TamB domain-containing protein [Sneathiella sp.]
MRKQIGKILAWAFLGPLLLLCVVLGSSYALLQTDAGRMFLSDQIEGAVSDDNGLGLEINGLVGNVFGDFAVAEVVLKDPKGDWLKLQNAEVSWSPFDLLRGEASIQNVSAELVTVRRQPDLPPAAQDEESSSGFALPIKLRLQRFYLDRVDVAEALFGRESSFQVSLNLNSRTASTLQSELKVTPLDGIRDFVAGDILYSLDTQRIGVFVEVEGEEKGLFSRLIGLPGLPALSASLTGDGPLTDWQGQLTANAEGVFSGDLLLLTNGDQIINAGISGGVDIAKELVADIPLTNGERITIDANLGFDTKNNKLEVSAVQVQNGVLNLEAKGDVDVKTLDVKGALKLSAIQMEPINKLIAPASMQDMTLHSEIVGNLEDLDVVVDFSVAQMRVSGSEEAPPVSVTDIKGTVTSSLVVAELENTPFQADVTLLEFSGLPDEIGKALGERIILQSKGNYASKSGTLEVQNAQMSADHLTLEANGRLNTVANSAEVNVVTDLDDLGVVTPSLKGAVQVVTKISSTDISKTFQARVDTSLSDLDFGNPELQELVGRKISLGADISTLGDLLSIQAYMPLKVGEVRANADIPMSFEIVDANLQLSLPKLAAFSKVAGSPLGGQSEIFVKVDGPLEDPSAIGDVAFTNLSVNDISVGQGASSFTANSIVSLLSGQVEGEFSSSPINAKFKAEYDLSDPSLLKVRNINLTQPGNLVEGALDIPLDGAPLSGEVKANISNYETLALVSPLPIMGQVSATVMLSEKGGGQAASLRLEGEKISGGADLPSMERLQANLEATNAFTDLEFSGEIQAFEVKNQDLTIETARVNARGILSDLAYEFAARSNGKLPFQLSGAGDVSLKETVQEVSFRKLSGSFGGEPIALEAPLNLSKRGEDVRVAPFTLAVGRGKVQGSANIMSDQALADFTVSSLPLELVQIFRSDIPISGDLRAVLKLQVTSDNSSGEMSAELDNVVLEGPDFEGIPPLSSSINGNLSGDQLRVTANLSGLDETSVTAEGGIPVKLSVSPFHMELPQSSPVTGKVNASGNLGKIWPLLGLDRHLLSGTLAANVAISGSIQKPEVKGLVELINGRYEEIELGTLIEQLQFRADAEDLDQISLQVSGTDGEDGRLNVSGTIGIADFANPDMNISAQLRKMAVLRQDLISIVTNADLSVRGNPTALTAQGNIVTETIEVDISGSTGPSVAEIQVTEVNFPQGIAEAKQEDTKSSPLNVLLDIGIELPRRVFVRGRGLDSEWEGRFSVKGSANNPIVSGQLNPVRGQFTFAGKAFELQEGAVLLRGQGEIDPELSLAAKYEGTDVTAIVRIEGKASNPQISFTSPDGLPQDEVLARVLFGKSAAKLSGVEALQLAQAVVEVSGGLGSGGGILGFARQAIGVDVLSAGVNEETGNAEVSVGKYVTDNIYVGVAQGATAGSTSAKVEIELTPNITVESETDQTSNSSVGVFWKWDY